jgi:hypothetical protein
MIKMYFREFGNLANGLKTVNTNTMEEMEIIKKALDNAGYTTFKPFEESLPDES